MGDRLFAKVDGDCKRVQVLGVAEQQNRG